MQKVGFLKYKSGILHGYKMKILPPSLFRLSKKCGSVNFLKHSRPVQGPRLFIDIGRHVIQPAIASAVLPIPYFQHISVDRNIWLPAIHAQPTKTINSNYNENAI